MGVCLCVYCSLLPCVIKTATVEKRTKVGETCAKPAPVTTYCQKTDTGFLTIVSRSGARTIVFTILVIEGEVAWRSALQVQIICPEDGRLCRDLEGRRQSPSPFKHQGQKERQTELLYRRSRILWANQKHVNVSSVAGKTIPRTSSDLSWPSMRSLLFNGGV